MEISESKRSPLPVRQDPSNYDELRKALSMLDVGEMVEVKMERQKVRLLRSYLPAFIRDRKFAMRTLTNDGETVKMGIWRLSS